MKKVFGIAALLLVLGTLDLAQLPDKPEPKVNGDITGLYSFLHEGEFVQIEVTDGKVSGLVSHFKNEDPDKAEFVDQFFEEAKLEGATLSFRTKPVDGLWFEFTGEVERGPAKNRGDEGYWTVRGSLVEHRSNANGEATEKAHGLTLKSFPEDVEPEAPGKGTEK